MTRQKKDSVPSKRSSKALNDEWKKDHPFKFVNIPLTDEEKEVILESTMDTDRVGHWIFSMAYERGYKVGVSYNNTDSCFVVAVTGTLYSRDDYNRCVTSRHLQLEVAVTIAAYKHSQYCAELIPDAATRSEAGNIFD